MKAGRYSVRFAVNNLKAKDSEFPLSLAASFPAVQSRIFQDKFYFNSYIQWSVDPRKGIFEWKATLNFPLGFTFYSSNDTITEQIIDRYPRRRLDIFHG